MRRSRRFTPGWSPPAGSSSRWKPWSRIMTATCRATGTGACSGWAATPTRPITSSSRHCAPASTFGSCARSRCGSRRGWRCPACLWCWNASAMTVEVLTRAEADKDAERQAAEGMASLAAGDAEAARIALLTAIAGGDVSPATRLNLALAEERLGRADRARKAIRALMEQLPGWDEPAVRLSESLRAAGRNAEAEEAYRHALEINPRRIEALLALGGLLILRGAGQEARDRLICCCGIAPDRA